MQATLRVITPPAVQAVDLDFAIRHARIDSDAERDLFAMYLDSATALVEKYLGRALITQTLRWSVSETRPNGSWPFPYPTYNTVPLAYVWTYRQLDSGIVELPYSPVQSIVTVTRGEWTAGDTTLVDGVDFDADLGSEPARLRLRFGYSSAAYNHLAVTYTAGYGDDPTSIPKPITNAVLMTALNLYENRGDEDKGGMSKAVQNLLTPYRIYTYGR
ncbi:head-tail connector protein [Paracraurococcus lichenis]|uniref:Phage gp6-like head-tail connector protein n=1 Tax=Paracraurococcus lichenis TaxID=3064888 RepID=A0ABT9E7A2_9PROT|nr:hypothetical protein [Paracraurococcus sp. LOR1-02]MDO9711972.1 hypothetical protein [Paracraurococcus sp. LOR1-02]